MLNEKIKTIINRIATDHHFREELKTDLKGVLKKAGLPVDEDSLNLLKKHIYATDSTLLSDAAGPGKVVATTGTVASVVAAFSTLHRSNDGLEQKENEDGKDSVVTENNENISKKPSRKFN